MILDDSYYMRIALNEAKTALEKNEIPIGAVIVANERIIAPIGISFFSKAVLASFKAIRI